MNRLYYFRHEVDIRLKSGRIIKMDYCDGDLTYGQVEDGAMLYDFHTIETFVNFLKYHSVCSHSDYTVFGRKWHSVHRYYDIQDFTFKESAFVSASVKRYPVFVEERGYTAHELMRELPAPDFFVYCKDHGMTVFPYNEK